MTSNAVRRFVLWMVASLICSSPAFGQVTTGNLLVNPGAELGAEPWEFPEVYLQSGPLSLFPGLALVGTEGTHWFGDDSTYSTPLLNFGSITVTQRVDVRPYSSIKALTVGMDATGAGISIIGDGQPYFRRLITLRYIDAVLNYLGDPTYVNAEPTTVTLESFTAFALLDLRATVSPVIPQGTAYIEASFSMATGMTIGTVASQVRTLVGIDDTFFSLTYIPIPGDYNHNGAVDAADYVVWRDSQLGSLVDANSGADGNGNGVIDLDDYNVWRAHFGQTSASGSSLVTNSGLATIPEPAGFVLLSLAVVSFLNLRRWRSPGRAKA
jgi:hypothetical protein